MGCEWAKAARKDSAYRSGRSRDWLKMKNADARELARSVEELRALGEVSRAVNSTLDLETVLSTIVAKAVQLPNTDAGVIYVFDELDQTLRVRATYGLSDELVAAIRSQPAGASDALRRAIQDRQPLASPPSETPRDLADFQNRHTRLHVSREKDGKLRLGAGMGRYEGRSAGRLRASSQGWNAGSEPPGRGSDDPPLQKLGPPSGPPGFFQLRVPLTCIEPCVFCTRF
jgi:hypothetical protein